MRRTLIVALLLVSAFYFTGCPGSSRGGKSILLPDGHKWPPHDIAHGDTVIPTDLPDVPVIPCGSDADCEGGVCDPATWTCVECYENSHCHEGGMCVNNTCYDQPQCTEDKTCPDGLVCDLESGLCVECLSDEDCPEPFLCVDQQCKAPCETDDDCPEGTHCNAHKNVCEECLEDDHCPPEQWCDLETGNCQDDVCPPGELVCVAGGVKECVENGSGYSDTLVCPEGTYCENGECVPVAVCTPGESYCLTQYAYKVCAANGASWDTVECPANQTCEDGADGHATCVPQCIPECGPVMVDNACLPDGCMGLCDLCMPGYYCPEGTAGLPPGTIVECLPDCSCENKECGDNGCGEWCGDCEVGFNCVVGQCIYVGYNCAEGYQCILDCPPFDENCLMQCIGATNPEDQIPLLDLFECITSVCGEFVTPECAAQASAAMCEKYAFQCFDCQPSCFGKECGADDCGGSCGMCPPGFACTNNQCVGSGGCDEILTCIETSEAPPDISIPMCLSQAGPDAQAQFLKLATCVQEACGEFVPYTQCYQLAVQTACAELFEQCKECVPSCIGKECGEDGCGGWCGFCEEGWDCDNGQCVCIPDCSEKECGPDQCSGLCGICPDNFQCTPFGKCTCTPDCVNKDCGGDECGGTCGFCQPGQYCTDNGSCIPFGNCTPGQMECDGNELLMCSQDGQEWISLGLCPAGAYCKDGACMPWLCTPGETICEGNGISECADNGAGWLAPELCPAGTVCQQGKCVPNAGCGGIPDVGCCDGNVLMKCIGNSVLVEQCGNMGCGWLPGVGYECGGQGADPGGEFPLNCYCEPDCTGKECGGDGCGGECGLCVPGAICDNGICLDVCVPECFTADGQKKECGDDNCDGVCGLCAANETCLDGQCIVPPTCELMLACAENCFFIGEECFAMCSAGASGGEYSKFKAVWDCLSLVCADSGDPSCVKGALLGACYQNYLACVSCTPSCENKECGPDNCGGSCGACPDNHDCQAGICIPVCIPNCDLPNGEVKECGDNGCAGLCGVCAPGFECKNGKCEFPCQPNCMGKECGSDGCGELCGLCPPGGFCNDAGMCQAEKFCGDLVCDPPFGEDCTTCPDDCGPCSDGCEPTQWPGCGGCPCEECVCAQDPFCCEVAWDLICVNECKDDCGGCCQPSCAGKECGPNGCGGSCGTCPADHKCDGGDCVPICVPDCDFKECGSDGCNGICGVCPPEETCKNASCFAGLPCAALIDCSIDCIQDEGLQCMYGCLDQGTPEAQLEFADLVQCVVFACGFDLSPDCLVSAMTSSCQSEYYQCMQCSPDCAGKECGPNGCGGSCGQCPDQWYCDNYKCKYICEPSCTDAAGVTYECGDNGCGGSCGQCDDDEECQNHKCVPICTPNCGGKQCGADGCGGQCGICPPDFTCSLFGTCIPVGPMCGDGECDFWDGEDCTSCPKDCGKCGDGCVTTPFPGCNGCSCEECVCDMDPYCCEAQWDGICVDECYECGGCGCEPDCNGKECGDDGCGGKCGVCPPDYLCKNGECEYICYPSCMGKQCGPDGCGGSCGKCPDGFFCNGSSLCEPVCTPNCSGKECGPDGCNGLCGLCGPDEACLNGNCIVAWDCQQLLNCAWGCPEGDEECNNACWANASPEAQEQYISIWQCVLEVCGPEPVEPCPGQAILIGECNDEYEACLGCTPSCTGKQCGPDGCGGSCGQCPPGYNCDIYGYCDCIPQCGDNECGPDGCGGLCGECPDGFQCNAWGNCVCLPDCLNSECGPDGCGGSCGQCGPGETCKFGICQEECVPDCWGKQCGPDGCGKLCGACPPGLVCNPDGQCQQIGPVCGNDICQGEENCLTCPQDCGACTGNCCEAHDSVGCDDIVVTKCVCSMDPFCCDVNWDGLCADQAINQCDADCGCTPSCVGKECGPDGCGGGCGNCAPGSYCNADGECIVFCEPKCEGKECGADGCGGECGECPSGSQCNSQGQCTCVPDCAYKECGPDGCGGECGQCAQFQTCTASGKCKYVTPLCGDGNCMGFIGEDCDACPDDCGECCGNGSCEPQFAENCQACPQDCDECCGNGFCDVQLDETCSNCPMDCGPCPAQCGDGLCEEELGETCVNCATDCGVCPGGCGDGQCSAWDDETCASCPDDCGGCEGECCEANGTPGCEDAKIQGCVCASDPYCCNVQWDGICADEVEGLNCGTCGGGVMCGDGECDADGETCESCPWDCGQCCGNGQCEPWYDEDCETCEPDCGPCGCIPDCAGKECGPDGCGDVCGVCQPGAMCTPLGICVGGGGGDSCSEILTCTTTCGGDFGCVLECYNNGSAEAQPLFWNLMTCVFGQCGMPPSAMCMFQSFMGACNAQYQECAAN